MALFIAALERFLVSSNPEPSLTDLEKLSIILKLSLRGLAINIRQLFVPKSRAANV